MKDLIDYSQETGKGPMGKLYRKFSFGIAFYLFLVLGENHSIGVKEAYLISIKMSNHCRW